MTKGTVSRDVQSMGDSMLRFFNSPVNEFVVLGRRLLFIRIIVETGRFPTAGEALTWLARRQVRLNAVRDRLNAISEHLWAEIARKDLKTFLTPERVEVIKQTLEPIELAFLKHALNALEDTGAKADRQIEKSVRDMAGLLKDRELWRLWDSQRRANTDTFRRMEKDACLEATGAPESLLDPSDRAFLEEMIRIVFDNGGNGGYREFHRLESERTAACVQEIVENDTLYLAPLTGEARKLPTASSFDALVQEIAKDPTRSIEAGKEIAIAFHLRHGQENLAKLSNQANEPPLEFIYLFPEGVIQGVCDSNPFVQEYAFRGILDAFGIDPRADATFVTRRTMSYGGISGKIGRYFILPAHPSRPGTLTLLLSEESEPFPLFWYCVCDEQEMRRLIQKNTLPPNWEEMPTLAEMQNAPLESFVPAAGLNPFRDRRWFNPEAITSHIERRRHATQLSKDTRVLSETP